MLVFDPNNPTHGKAVDISVMLMYETLVESFPTLPYYGVSSAVCCEIVHDFFSLLVSSPECHPQILFRNCIVNSKKKHASSGAGIGDPQVRIILNGFLMLYITNVCILNRYREETIPDVITMDMLALMADMMAETLQRVLAYGFGIDYDSTDMSDNMLNYKEAFRRLCL